MWALFYAYNHKTKRIGAIGTGEERSSCRFCNAARAPNGRIRRNPGEATAASEMYPAGLRPVLPDLPAFSNAAEVSATAGYGRTCTIIMDSTDSPSNRAFADATAASNSILASGGVRFSAAKARRLSYQTLS